MKLAVGIDTSCYTTSVAVVDGNGIVAEKRTLLQVPVGGRGLRQAEAVFQHVKNLPALWQDIAGRLEMGSVEAVGAAVRPRPLEGSYMPVFRVAESFGRFLAASLGVPFYPFSHQEGHIRAGIFSAGGPLGGEFLAVHLSGGTTEMLRVNAGRPVRSSTKAMNGAGYSIEKIGGSSDLAAGQFVDRVGVALGLNFPAGPALEKMAREAEEAGLLGRGGEDCPRLKPSMEGLVCSLSGPESAAQRLIAQGVAGPAVARAVEHCLAETLGGMAREARRATGLGDMLLAGGVAGNGYIRRYLQETLAVGEGGLRLYFAEPALASDNAVGIALLAWENRA